MCVMKLIDLEVLIPAEEDVGMVAIGEDSLPIVDTWENWLNGGLKTLDVEISKISSCGYLLLELKV